VKTDDAGGLPFIHPRFQIIGAANPQPSQIKNLERAAAPGPQPADTLEGLDIVVERGADKRSDVDVGLARRLPVIEPVNERFETGEREGGPSSRFGNKAIAADMRAGCMAQRKDQPPW
jgi:hypothetical protein